MYLYLYILYNLYTLYTLYKTNRAERQAWAEEKKQAKEKTNAFFGKDKTKMGDSMANSKSMMRSQTAGAHTRLYLYEPL